MQNLLFHIDSRCLHGQVVTGWGFHEQIKRFLLANDAVAADAWERNQYLNAPGKEFETLVLSVADSIACLKAWSDDRKTMLITDSPRDALRILNGTVKVDLITIGNLEPGPVKRQLSPTVFVAAEDREQLREVIRQGVKVVIKPLPTSTPIVVSAPLIAE